MMKKPSRTTIVQCPTCKTSIEWSRQTAPAAFLFSERCQQIDFGDWASETFTIAGGAGG